jgi:recombination protein RecA
MPPSKTKKAPKPPETSTPPEAVVSEAPKSLSAIREVAKVPGGLMKRLTTALKGGESEHLVIPASSGTVKLRGVVPTGSETLDAATGRGGYPFGRITLLTGDGATGKTTHALHAVANVQKMGGVAMYVDLEQKLDIDYAVGGLGVDPENMLIANPGYGERAFELMHGFISKIPREQDIPIVVVLDSINACIPKAVFEAEDYETTGGMGAQARIFSAAVPKLVQILAGRRVAVLVIGQPRDKLTQAGSFKEKIPGGATWKFYSALVIELKRDKEAEVKGKGGASEGHGIIAECIKNQIAPPFKKGHYSIVWGSGIDYDQSLLTQASKSGVLNVGTGGWGEFQDPVQPPHAETCATLQEPLDSEVACDCGWKAKIVKWQGLNGYRKMSAARPDIPLEIRRMVRSKFK